MSLFQFLALQPVEPDDDSSDLDYFEKDEMSLDDTIDGVALDAAWSHIVEGVASDPEWQSFASDDE